jgi:hypothetical protein
MVLPPIKKGGTGLGPQTASGAVFPRLSSVAPAGGSQLLRLPSTEEGVAEEDCEENWNKAKDIDSVCFSRAPSGASALVAQGKGAFSRAASGASNNTEAKMNWKLAGVALKSGAFSRAGSDQSLVQGDAGAGAGVGALTAGKEGKKKEGGEGVLKEVAGTGQVFRELNWKKVRTRQARQVLDAYFRHRRGETAVFHPQGSAGDANGGGRMAPDTAGGYGQRSSWMTATFQLEPSALSSEFLGVDEVEYFLELMGVTIPKDQIESAMGEWGMADVAGNSIIDFAGLCWMLGLRPMGKHRRALALLEKQKRTKSKDTFSRRSSTSTVLSAETFKRSKSNASSEAIASVVSIVSFVSGGARPGTAATNGTDLSQLEDDEVCGCGCACVGG